MLVFFVRKNNYEQKVEFAGLLSRRAQKTLHVSSKNYNEANAKTMSKSS